MTEKVKPCPFCGEIDGLVTCLEDGMYYEECMTCSARGPAEYTKNGAVKSWNCREEAAHER